ncbi:MAG: hypothetical protein RDU59_12870 [Thermodesulfobacteriota bacterium]|nr:hypothetical protein [Thermodesulfobacteriota bacterium]
MNFVKSEHTWLTLQDAGKLTGKNPSAIRMWVKRKMARGEQILIKKKKGKHGDIMLIHSSEIECVNAHVKAENKSPSFNDEQNPHNIAIYEFENVNPEPLTGGAQYASAKPEALTNPEHVKGSFIEFIEFYDKKRLEWERERDSLMQGLLMYRYKFEEIDSKLKALPAPPEIIAEEIRQKETAFQSVQETIIQKDEALAQAQRIIDEEQLKQQQQAEAMEQLKVKLQKEEQAKEDYRIHWEQAQAKLKRPWWKMALIAIGMWKI